MLRIITEQKCQNDAFVFEEYKEEGRAEGMSLGEGEMQTDRRRDSERETKGECVCVYMYLCVNMADMRVIDQEFLSATHRERKGASRFYVTIFMNSNSHLDILFLVLYQTVCCSVLQCVAVRCIVVQCMCYSVC